jgi:hypothetical protein
MIATFVIYGIITVAAVGSLTFWGLAYRGYKRDTAPSLVHRARPAVAVMGVEPAFRKAA